MSSTTGQATARLARSSEHAVVSGITVGVGSFAGGHDAAALGAALADATGGDLVFVSVHSEPLFAVPGWDWKMLRRQAEHTLIQVRDEFAPHAGTAIETSWSTPATLTRVVKRRHHGILVVGSSREGAVGRVQIGKRTRELLADLPCALAIAPRGLGSRKEFRVRRIGVGFDGGSEAVAALELAGAIAVHAGAELTVEAIVDDRVPVLMRPTFTEAFRSSWAEVVRAEQERLRREAEEAAARTGAAFTVHVDRGKPGDALVGFSGDIDLLIVGSRRWGPVARVLLGSTGETLARKAHCALMVVPRTRTAQPAHRS